MILEKKNNRPILIGLLLLTILIAIFSLSTGDNGFDLNKTLTVLSGQGTSATQLIFYKIRLPRIAVSLIAGASLALSGLLLQTLTHNPLADSGILGINTGAGLVVAVVISYFDIESFNVIRWMPFFAMLGSFATVFIVYLTARKPGIGISPIRLIITGVGFSTMLSGLMVSLVGNLNQYKMDYIVNWLSGRMTGDRWHIIALVTPILIGLWWLTYRRSQALNIMNLNEQTALALGLNLQKERLISLILATALAAISVVLVGNIAFIGLLAANLSKRLVGGNHKIAIPVSMLLGSITLLIADTIGRVLLVGTGIPTGLIVSIVGAPYFLYLMKRHTQ